MCILCKLILLWEGGVVHSEFLVKKKSLLTTYVQHTFYILIMASDHSRGHLLCCVAGICGTFSGKKIENLKVPPIAHRDPVNEWLSPIDKRCFASKNMGGGQKKRDKNNIKPAEVCFLQKGFFSHYPPEMRACESQGMDCRVSIL